MLSDQSCLEDSSTACIVYGDICEADQVNMSNTLSEEDDYELIDSHIHLYSTLNRCDKLNWLNRDHVLYHPHSYDDYVASPSSATSAIFIECDTVVQEDYAAHFEEFQDAASSDGIKAIVAWAPTINQDVLVAYLNKIRAMDGRGLLRGVRVLLQDKPDGYCIEPEFLKCIRHLGSVGLLFEIGIDVRSRGKTQLEEVLILIQNSPGTIFVIDHLAKPDLGDVSSDYQAYMTRIASNQNVSMKLSGGLTQLTEGDALPNDILAAYIKLNLELFGTHRLLYGSDWPVLSLSPADSRTDKTPRGWFQYCKQTLQELGVAPADLRKIFAGNARRIYKLD